ncbi:uncharacterized protein TNCV_3706421 [Trichonephila clavipes]|nr:uncharacterized protein TNCV_3706421 [Trichonephila clavipes]
MSKKDLNTRIARWALNLQDYDYTILHRSGSQMAHVDALSRIQSGKQEGFLHPLVKDDISLNTYHIDHLGPLATSSKNYKFILAVIDSFTKFVWLYPTKTTSTSEVIKKLDIQKTTFGNPRFLITDRRTTFTSDEFHTYCSEQKITLHHITTVNLSVCIWLRNKYQTRRVEGLGATDSVLTSKDGRFSFPVDEDILVTPLLTLEEIIDNEDELEYIAILRGVIKCQLEYDDDIYEYLRKKQFFHEIVCHGRQRLLLEVCLAHALTKVVKSHVVVHNLEPFRQWDVINIDVDGFPEGQNPVIWRENVDSKLLEHIQNETLFLVTAFYGSDRLDFLGDFSSYTYNVRRLFTGIHLEELQVSDVDYWKALHKSTWRRVFNHSLSLFSCMDKDIAAYIKEQTKIRKPMNVFKQILNRGWGEPFDQFEVLKVIASPYYFVLPHQNKREYAMFESLQRWKKLRDSCLYKSYGFVCSLFISKMISTFLNIPFSISSTICEVCTCVTECEKYRGVIRGRLAEDGFVLDESRSFFRVHTGYFSNIPKCIKAEFIASWACSQSSVVSSSKR